MIKEKKTLFVLLTLCVLLGTVIGTPVSAKTSSANTTSPVQNMSVTHHYSLISKGQTGDKLSFSQMKDRLSPNSLFSFIGLGVSDNKRQALAADSNIIPMISGPCPSGNGIHRMVSHAWGSVYLNGVWQFDGDFWQCSNCYDVIITEGDPLLGQNIGRYAEWSIDYPLSGSWCYMNTNYVGHCNSTSKYGYNFVNAG